jgi:hypothetical protein
MFAIAHESCLEIEHVKHRGLCSLLLLHPETGLLHQPKFMNGALVNGLPANKIKKNKENLLQLHSVHYKLNKGCPGFESGPPNCLVSGTKEWSRYKDLDQLPEF